MQGGEGERDANPTKLLWAVCCHCFMQYMANYGDGKTKQKASFHSRASAWGQALRPETLLTPYTIPPFKSICPEDLSPAQSCPTPPPPLQVMSTLKDLATSGHTVVASIHQPRSSIFSLFDDLVLLSEGEVVYCGPAVQAVPHFAALGHACPPAFSPADNLADLIAIDYRCVCGGGEGAA